MDLLKFVARRSYLSEVIYVLLNLALALGVWLLVAYFNSPLPAYALILVSKWRVFSVRPRFWFANIQSNAVDILTGFGFATLLFGTPSIVMQTILVLLYAAWLLYLKPRTSRTAIGVQAAVSQLVALSALYVLAYAWDVSTVVVLAWVIGYAAARHILSSFEEKSITLLSFIWGFVVAELAWLAFHLNLVFNVPLITASTKIPQVGLLVTILGVIAYEYYAALSSEDSKASVKKLFWPTVIGSVILLYVIGLPVVRLLIDPTSLNT